LINQADIKSAGGVAPRVRTQAPPGAPPNSAEFEDLKLPKIDSNKSHHIFDDPRHRLDGLVTEFGSQEDAFQAVASATRDAVKAKGITGKFVRRRYIGTVFIPWKR
jgi:hypothetical protein